MPLPIGAQPSPYEAFAPAGAGCMGEVSVHKMLFDESVVQDVWG